MPTNCHLNPLTIFDGIFKQNLRKAEEEGEKWRDKPKQAARTSSALAARRRFSPFAHHRHLSRYQCKSGEFSAAHVFCPWCGCLSSDGLG
ncbi:hypothetical protein Aduo_002854 [Ancylostoma duodenale]